MKKIVYILLVIIFIASFITMLKVITFTFWPDFNIFYSSATALFQGHNPYLLKGAFIGGYLYPPISLLIFYPFIIFPYELAGRLWAVVSIASLFLSVFFLLKLYNALNNRILVLIVGILVCNYFPVKFTLGMGQINNVVLLLITASLYTFMKNKKYVAGELIGVSLLLKYFLLLIFPYLLVKRYFGMFTAALLTVLGVILISFVLIKPDISIYFFKNVIYTVSTAPGGYYYNQALSGFLVRDFTFLSSSQIAVTRIILSLLFIGITLWFMLMNKKNEQKTYPLEFSIIITLSLLLNTFSLQHHFVLLLIPLLVTYFILIENKANRYYYIILAVCYILTAVNIKNPTAYPALTQSHVFYGALLLWIFDLYLLQKMQKNIKKLNNQNKL